MYDIVSRKLVGDYLILTCISDEDEDLLEKAFYDMVENDNDSNIPVKSIVKKLIQDGLNDQVKENSLFEIYYDYYPLIIAIYSSPKFDVTTPPPNTEC